MLAPTGKLLGAHVLARGTLEGAPMQPAAGKDAYADLLARVIALVRVVGHQDVNPSVGALVVVAAGAPVLPLARLLAAPLLPHALRVVKAFGTRPVRLQREILLRLCGRWKKEANKGKDIIARLIGMQWDNN